jgi:outer membrane protein TolC
MPIDSQAVRHSLAPVDMARVKAEAQAIDNPLLRPLLNPVSFDLSDGLSLDEAAILAVIANPGLKAERDRLGLARAQVLKAGILPNPRVSAGLERPTGGPTKGTVNAYNAQIEWDITSLISRAAELDAQKKDLRSVELDVAWKEWQVAEAARLAFVRLFWAQKRYALLKDAEKDMKERLNILEQAAAQGNETMLDLNAARAAFSQFELELLKTKGDVEKERLALNQAIGLSPQYEIAIQDMDITSWPNEFSEKDLSRGLDKRRLDLAALKKGYEGEEARLRAEILKQFPKMALGIVRARDTGAIVTTGLTVSIELPVFDRNQGNIAIEKATRQRLFDEYMARLFDARSQIASIVSDMKAVRAQAEASQQAAMDKRRLLESLRPAFKRGDIGAIGYYQVLEEFLNKELETLSLKGNMCELSVALEASSGLYMPLSRSLAHLKSLQSGDRN